MTVSVKDNCCDDCWGEPCVCDWENDNMEIRFDVTVHYSDGTPNRSLGVHTVERHSDIAISMKHLAKNEFGTVGYMPHSRVVYNRDYSRYMSATNLRMV